MCTENQQQNEQNSWTQSQVQSTIIFRFCVCVIFLQNIYIVVCVRESSRLQINSNNWYLYQVSVLALGTIFVCLCTELWNQRETWTIYMKHRYMLYNSEPTYYSISIFLVLDIAVDIRIGVDYAISGNLIVGQCFAMLSHNSVSLCSIEIVNPMKWMNERIDYVWINASSHLLNEFKEPSYCFWCCNS